MFLGFLIIRIVVAVVLGIILRTVPGAVAGTVLRRVLAAAAMAVLLVHILAISGILSTVTVIVLVRHFLTS